MRGLTLFISDIRECRSREEETKRINKELANIRVRFTEPNLSAYHHKKYMCKLLYIHLLGYQVDFGLVQAIKLVSSLKIKEKSIGYLAASLFLNESHDIIHLFVNSLKKDLNPSSLPYFTCLALHTVANVGGQILADSLAPDVITLLSNTRLDVFVRKKAALALMKLINSPSLVEIFPQDLFESIEVELTNGLLSSNTGLSCSMASLWITLIQKNYIVSSKLADSIVNHLKSIISNKSYQYEGVTAPWYISKLLQILGMLSPSNEVGFMDTLVNLFSSAQALFSHQSRTTINSKNIKLGLLFDATYTLLKWVPNHDILVSICSFFSSGHCTRMANIRYMTLCLFAEVIKSNSDKKEIIFSESGDFVFMNCRDKDVSVRSKAIYILFEQCNQQTASTVVNELMHQLEFCSYDASFLAPTTALQTKQSLVRKMAVLIEKFAPCFSWYFTNMCLLLARAKDDVDCQDIWYRVANLCKQSSPHDQRVCALTAFSNLAISFSESSIALKSLCCYIVGELAQSLKNNVEQCSDEECCCPQTFSPKLLIETVNLMQNSNFAITLTMLYKISLVFEQVKPEICEILTKYSTCHDEEVQERACEYLSLI